MRLFYEFVSLFCKDEEPVVKRGIDLRDNRATSPITVTVDEKPIGQLEHRIRDDGKGYWYFKLTAHDQMLGPLGLREIADLIDTVSFDEKEIA